MTLRLLGGIGLLLVPVSWWLRPDPGRGGGGVEPACGDSVVVAWEPPSPQQGALFRVRLDGIPPDAEVGGDVAGEPLHFVAIDSGGRSRASLAPVPIDGDTALPLHLRCRLGGRSDSLAPLTVRVATASYPLERLRVAPVFGRPPDSALGARIRQESRRAVDVATRAHATPRLWRESFVVPRRSRVTSAFGHGREFNGTITSRHMGTDFAGAPGAPVVAANRGVVRIVDAFYYGGNVVYLDHGTGLTSAYLHLSEQLVAVGDTVERGQAIGLVGATGRVTGPHLHLIVRYGAVTVDPMSLFALSGEPADSIR